MLDPSCGSDHHWERQGGVGQGGAGQGKARSTREGQSGLGVWVGWSGAEQLGALPKAAQGGSTVQSCGRAHT